MQSSLSVFSFMISAFYVLSKKFLLTSRTWRCSSVCVLNNFVVWVCTFGCVIWLALISVCDARCRAQDSSSPSGCTAWLLLERSFFSLRHTAFSASDLADGGLFSRQCPHYLDYSSVMVSPNKSIGFFCVKPSLHSCDKPRLVEMHFSLHMFPGCGLLGFSSGCSCFRCESRACPFTLLWLHCPCWVWCQLCAWFLWELGSNLSCFCPEEFVFNIGVILKHLEEPLVKSSGLGVFKN